MVPFSILRFLLLPLPLLVSFSSAGLRQYPDNPFSNRLDLLHILIVGQTQGIVPYQQGLKQFIESNEDGELKRYANELLQASYKFEGNHGTQTGPTFEQDFDQPHYFVVVFKPKSAEGNNLLRLIDSYNSQQEADRKLKATTIELTKNKSMIFVSQFSDKSTAMAYFRGLERNNLFSGGLENAALEYFVISKNNFSTLYNSKDVGKYIAFFQKFYY